MEKDGVVAKVAEPRLGEQSSLFLEAQGDLQIRLDSKDLNEAIK